VRSYWLLGLFHVSVLIRLKPFYITIGDDVLKYAGRLLMQLRLRGVYEPELMFSKLEQLIKQIYEQVYEVISDSVCVKIIIQALFDNIFTTSDIYHFSYRSGYRVLFVGVVDFDLPHISRVLWTISMLC
jgi:hypothetical protein